LYFCTKTTLPKAMGCSMYNWDQTLGSNQKV
jgi:hypothetical protein